MSNAIGTLAFRLLLLFSVIGCGFGAYKAKMIDEHTSKQMTNYLNKVAIPVFLITAVGTKPILDGSINLVYCGVIMALYYLIAFGGVYFISMALGKDRAIGKTAVRGKCSSLYRYHDDCFQYRLLHHWHADVQQR